MGILRKTAIALGVLFPIAFNPVANGDPGKKVSEEDAYSAREGRDSVAEKDESAPVVAVPPPAGLVPSTLLALGAGTYFSPFALVVDKSTRTLTVWRQDGGQIKNVESVPVDLGRKPGDKKTLGDRRTPEGIYFFQDIYEAHEINFDEYGERAFTTDYPNFYDRLSRKTGNGIWLHGTPDKRSLRRGSRGCVVVRNDVIKRIGQYITPKLTPLIIEDQVSYGKPDQHKLESDAILGWLENWRKSWESKNIDEYMAFYASGFTGLGMGLKGWRRYKSNLANKYSFISVKAAEPIAFGFRDQVIVRFVQIYSSDKNADFGEKTLYLTRKPGANSSAIPFEILNEEWSAIENPLLAAKFNSPATLDRTTATQ